MVRASHLILGCDVSLEKQPAILTQASTTPSAAAPAVLPVTGLQTGSPASAVGAGHKAKPPRQQPQEEIKQREGGTEACHFVSTEGRTGRGQEGFYSMSAYISRTGLAQVWKSMQ